MSISSLRATVSTSIIVAPDNFRSKDAAQRTVHRSVLFTTRCRMHTHAYAYTVYEASKRAHAPCARRKTAFARLGVRSESLLAVESLTCRSEFGLMNTRIHSYATQTAQILPHLRIIALSGLTRAQTHPPSLKRLHFD